MVRWASGSYLKRSPIHPRGLLLRGKHLRNHGENVPSYLFPLASLSTPPETRLIHMKLHVCLVLKAMVCFTPEIHWSSPLLPRLKTYVFTHVFPIFRAFRRFSLLRCPGFGWTIPRAADFFGAGQATPWEPGGVLLLGPVGSGRKTCPGTQTGIRFSNEVFLHLHTLFGWILWMDGWFGSCSRGSCLFLCLVLAASLLHESPVPCLELCRSRPISVIGEPWPKRA